MEDTLISLAIISRRSKCWLKINLNSLWSIKKSLRIRSWAIDPSSSRLWAKLAQKLSETRGSRELSLMKRPWSKRTKRSLGPLTQSRSCSLEIRSSLDLRIRSKLMGQPLYLPVSFRQATPLTSWILSTECMRPWWLCRIFCFTRTESNVVTHPILWSNSCTRILHSCSSMCQEGKSIKRALHTTTWTKLMSSHNWRNTA